MQTKYNCIEFATALFFVVLTVCPCIVHADSSVTNVYSNERAVSIAGYDGDAMEPFLSRDGQHLIFNSLNDAKDTSLYYAIRVDDFNFKFAGRIEGANGRPPHLDAVGSSDVLGNFYWVSNRDYPDRFENYMRGTWSAGAVGNIQRVAGDIYIRKPGWIVMDAEISPDGKTLFYANAYFSGDPIPDTSDISIARNVKGVFNRDAKSDWLLTQVNTAALEYAPSTTSDGLSLFFTRLESGKTTIHLSRRKTTQEPFGPPLRLRIEGDTPEAPSVSLDQKLLYFHKRVRAGYSIFVLTRQVERELKNGKAVEQSNP